jgi:hypothetical protein
LCKKRGPARREALIDNRAYALERRFYMRSIETGMYKDERQFIIDVVEVDPNKAENAYMQEDREWARSQTGTIRCGSVFDKDRGEEVCVYEVENVYGGCEWIKAPNPLVRLMRPAQIAGVKE